MSIQLYFIIGYFLIVLIIGLLSTFLSKSSDDFLVAGRKMGIVLCAATIAGEWIGGTSTIGTSQVGYLYGISAAWFPIANSIGILILSLTLAKLYRRSEVVTVTEFLEKYFGKRVRITASIILTLVMTVSGSVQIVAGGALMNTVTGMNMKWAMIIMGFIFLVYTLAGGMWAVGITNVINMAVIYIGLILGLFYTASVYGGFDVLTASLPAQPYFSMGGEDPLKIGGWIITSLLAALVSQAAVQPIMGAKNERTAQVGTVISSLLIIPVGFIGALLGMYAKIAFPNISSFTALPQLLMSFPPWIGGVIMAGILAAILSTVAPCILAAGTLMAKDVYQGVFNKEASDQQIYKLSRIYTLIFGVLAIVFALYCKVILDQIYFGFTLRSTLAILLLFAVYWKAPRPAVALWSLVITAGVAVYWEIMKTVNGYYPLKIYPIYIILAITIIITMFANIFHSSTKNRADRIEKILD